jgi:hypothetical protein
LGLSLSIVGGPDAGGENPTGTWTLVPANFSGSFALPSRVKFWDFKPKF